MAVVGQKIYEVVASRAVMVEHSNGHPVNYPPGGRFSESPSNGSVARLLRINAIREVMARELPYKG